MSSRTANDIIQRALVKARILSPGEAVSAPIAAQSFFELNDMLETWVLEKLMVLSDSQESFSMVVGQSEYTFGSGGDFDSSRPTKIKDSVFVRCGSTDYPVVLITLDAYRRKSDKATGTRPERIAYSPEYPLGKVYLWPTPASIDRIYIRSSKEVVSFTDRTTAVSLAPGYSAAIISNLAVVLSANFGKKVSDELAFLAGGTKKAIKSSNSEPTKLLVSDLGATINSSGGNINSGPWV